MVNGKLIRQVFRDGSRIRTGNRMREREREGSAEAVSVSGYPAKWLVAQVEGS